MSIRLNSPLDLIFMHSFSCWNALQSFPQTVLTRRKKFSTYVNWKRYPDLILQAMIWATGEMLDGKKPSKSAKDVMREFLTKNQCWKQIFFPDPFQFS